MQEKKTNVPGEKPEYPETGKQGGQGDVGKKGGDLGEDTGKSPDIGKQHDKPVDKP